MSPFTVDTLQKIQVDLQTRKIPMDRLAIADDEVIGLRAIISRSAATFFVTYEIQKIRQMLPLGDVSEISVDDARKMASYVRNLAKQGVDVRAETDERMRRQLREDTKLECRP